jgi:hypothetical protein
MLTYPSEMCHIVCTNSRLGAVQMADLLLVSYLDDKHTETDIIQFLCRHARTAAPEDLQCSCEKTFKCRLLTFVIIFVV